jgi:erythronate-4-phosphate dehydrogenase
MINMIADASLQDLHSFFSDEFQITLFHNSEDLQKNIQNQDVLLCRSTLKVDVTMLKNSTINCIATVSSGTDHIVQDVLQTQTIQLIDAKGANACAVADYVVASLAYCEQRSYVAGKKVGIIGAGAVGQAVAQHLEGLHYFVQSYDPLRATHDTLFKSCTLTDLFDCDVLCVHANLHATEPYPSRHLLDALFFSKLKPHTIVINAARGNLVDEAALLACSQPIYYCTDVYANEPFLNPALIQYATLCTPHIAGHSVEAKRRALWLVSQKLHRYYNLNSPSVCVQTDHQEQFYRIQKLTTWQSEILNLYNPELETTLLKQSQDLTQTFLDVRKAHYRHEF